MHQLVDQGDIERFILYELIANLNQIKLTDRNLLTSQIHKHSFKFIQIRNILKLKSFVIVMQLYNTLCKKIQPFPLNHKRKEKGILAPLWPKYLNYPANVLRIDCCPYLWKWVYIELKIHIEVVHYAYPTGFVNALRMLPPAGTPEKQISH